MSSPGSSRDSRGASRGIGGEIGGGIGGEIDRGLRRPWLLRADLAAAAALLMLVALRWHDIAGHFWRADDPALLLHALQSPGLAAFVDPADWRRLSPNNLTPWVTLSFKLDLALAGLRPAVFYVHQLVSAALVALAAYALGRQALPPAWAAALVLLGLAGAPTDAVTELLMTRHYVEGLLFALLSLLCFVRARRPGGRPARRGARLAWAWAGAALYALACSAKEIYVPLVLVVACLPAPRHAAHDGPRRAPPDETRDETTWGDAPDETPPRWLLLLPWLLVALAYVAWRRVMLGDAVGGYGGAQPLLSFGSVAAMAQAAARFPADLFGPAWWLVLLLALPAAALALRGRPAWLGFAALAAACVLLPLWPLAVGPGFHGPDRYLYLLWWAAAAGLVAALRGAVVRLPLAPRWRDAVGLGLVGLLVLAAALQSAAVARPREEAMRAFDAVGRFIARHDARDAFIAPDAVLAGYWYVTSLCEIRQRAGASCPQALIPGWPLDERVTRLSVYDPASGTMADASTRLAQERRRAAALDRTRPLSVALSLDGGVVRWQFGPHRDGQYFVVSPLLGRYPLPPQGELRTTQGELPFQVQFDARDGWRTASPVLVVRPGQPVAWSRGAPG
jgi:hypothetical protein